MDTSSTYKTTRLMIGNFPAEEIRILLLNWQPGERNVDFTNRLLYQGILDKKTSSAIVGKVRMFKGWFETPDDRAARRLQMLVKIGIDSQILQELVFLYKARTEPILRDFAVDCFWPAVFKGELYISKQIVNEYIQQKQKIGQLNKDLSESVVIHLQRAITGTLVNADFLEDHNGLWELVTYRPTDLLISYLAYDLHLDNQTDNAIVDHPDWSLFGMTRTMVVDQLADLGKQSGMIVQHAGSVVRITWLYSSMEEVLNACAR
ncbi:MAG: DUF1819 family protein [Anaerolineaceae bacterium]|nr:DUF1819 family protein [Anaerolineaceae bacterium]